MRFRRIKEGDVILGIAPLIDIVFLLLIFFIVTSHFDISSGIMVKLPSITERKKDNFQDKKIIIINNKGEIFIDRERVDKRELGDRLEKLKKESGISGIILQADRDVKHGLVIDVMDEAKRAGIGSVFISARLMNRED